MIPAAACVLFVALLVFAEYKNSRLGRWLAKPAASLAFVIAALGALPLGDSFGRWMLAGVILAALGDVLLIPPRLFLAGVGAFLLGHVCYAVAFAIHGLSPRASALALVPVLLASGVVVRWLYPKVPSKLKPAIVAYAVVISVMVILAAGTRKAWIVMGALAFYVSDLAVARNKFVKESFANRAWGLPLYYGAQLVLATGHAW